MRIVSSELHNYIKYIRITRVEEKIYSKVSSSEYQTSKDTSQKIAIVNI